MKREAEKRLLCKVAAQDPEIAAIIEGRQVENPVDPALFILKKVGFQIPHVAINMIEYYHVIRVGIQL